MKSARTLVFCLATATQLLHAHDDHGVTRLDQFRKPRERINLRIPDLPGFTTLKCDFHMHTVFSDGQVWPGIRVEEAWQEGLDAICITDHIEHQPHAEDLPSNHNRPYEIARKPAREQNILLIKGSEITRGTPPGHFNAMFIDDAAGFVQDKDAGLNREAINRAAAQNAFIFWNHPGWKADTIDGSYEWIPFVEDLHKDGKLHGIEVFNGFGFHRKALDWCVDKSLAVLGTTDIHTLTSHEYDFAKGRTRTMTLVFAKERTLEAVREALSSARTVAWSSEFLAGPEPLLQGLFHGAVRVGPVHHETRNGVGFIEITNDSDLTFTLCNAGNAAGFPARVTLNPRKSVTLKAANIATLLGGVTWTVENAFVRSDKNLSVILKP